MRTGFEMFTGVGQDGHVAEKAEGDTDTGWLFPVGVRAGSLGYMAMFMDMFKAISRSLFLIIPRMPPASGTAAGAKVSCNERKSRE